MPNIGLYNGSPTDGAADGTLVTGANPISFTGLIEGTNGESTPQKIGVRTTQAGKYVASGKTITPGGADAAMIALAPDSGGSAGTFGAFGAALTLGVIDDTNTLIWVKAKNTSGEPDGTDVDATLVISGDAFNTPPEFSSGPQPTTIRDTSAVITWAATDDDGDTVTAKVIVKTSSTAPTEGEWTAESNQTSPFTKSGLTKNTVYYYWVRLHDGTQAVVSTVGSFTTSLIASSGQLLDLRGSVSGGSTPRADGATTSPWEDFSTNNRDGTLTNGPIWRGVGTSGDPYCLELDGSNDYVDLANLSAWDICGSGKSWSLEAWIKTSDSAATNRGIFERFLSVTGGFAMAVRTTQKAGVTVVVSGTNTTLVSTAADVNDGNWHHIVATYDDGTKDLKIYVDNGTADTTTLGASPSNDSSESLKLGGDGSSTQRFPGRIAQARIYDRALSSGEVSDHYTAGVTA